MFNLSGSEIIVILLLALVVLGPDKLPDAMRKAGKTFAELKKLSSGFQDEVRKGFEEPVKEVKKTAAVVKSAAKFPTTTTTITSSATDDKQRYNPAVDPPPSLPEGESIAEPTVVADVAGDPEAAGPDPADAITVEPTAPTEAAASPDSDAEAEAAT